MYVCMYSRASKTRARVKINPEEKWGTTRIFGIFGRKQTHFTMMFCVVTYGDKENVKNKVISRSQLFSQTSSR